MGQNVMSEHNAHAALTATARLRVMAEPVEDAQLMTFSERQYRAREARGLQIAGMVADTVQAQVDAIVDTLVVKTGWPDFREGDRKYRLTAHEIAQQDGFPDT